MGEQLDREFTMAFWKAHVLHHAAVQPIYGLWLLEELARHGYRTSPGTLYPLLARMERNGLLRSTAGASAKARRSYVITTAGRRVLRTLREKIAELHREVVAEARARRKRRPRGGGSE
jgi:PadR family transcriptional regulator, regulatory protein PadR